MTAPFNLRLSISHYFVQTEIGRQMAHTGDVLLRRQMHQRRQQHMLIGGKSLLCWGGCQVTQAIVAVVACWGGGGGGGRGGWGGWSGVVGWGGGVVM